MQSAPQELLKQYVQSQHLLSYGGRRQDFSIVWSDQANTGQTGGPFQTGEQRATWNSISRGRSLPSASKRWIHNRRSEHEAGRALGTGQRQECGLRQHLVSLTAN